MCYPIYNLLSAVHGSFCLFDVYVFRTIILCDEAVIISSIYHKYTIVVFGQFDIYACIYASMLDSHI